MATSTTHAALPYPIRKARFTLAIPYLDADGDPTDPGTPDTEFSLDASGMADCAEEATTVSTGFGYITLTGAETDGSLLLVQAKVSTGPKNTLIVLYPKNLAILFAGTASAGAAGTLTFPVGTYTPIDLTGCFIRTTGGTGGGGTGGANNQARRIISYVKATRVATVSPNWETTPDNTTTFDVLLPEGVVAAQLSAGAPLPIAAGTVVDYISATSLEIVGHASIRKGHFIYAETSTGIGGMAVILSHSSGVSGASNTTLEEPGLPAALLDATTTYTVFAGPNGTAVQVDEEGRPVSIVEVIRTADADVGMTGTGGPGDPITAVVL